MNPKWSRYLSGGRPRLAVAGFVILLSVLVAGFADNRAGGLATPTPGDRAEPRIPLAGGREQDQPAHTRFAADPACIDGCLVRVSGDPEAAPLWARNSTAYLAADPEIYLRLQDTGLEPTVVWPNLETRYLYVMYEVQAAHDALIDQIGTIVDRAGDIRLVESDRLPLRVSQLYQAGVWVEKLPPAVTPATPSKTTLDYEDTIRAIVSLGSRYGSQRGDRQFDGPGTTIAAEYLFRRFAELGFAVRYEDFRDPEGRHQLNVIADPPMRTTRPKLVITAHYDSISPAGQPAPGADDNASGLAALLELARRVAFEGFTRPVRFVAFGAEEPGLYGSAAHVGNLVEAGEKLAGVINIDSMGIPNQGRVFINGDAASRWIYRELVELSSDKYWLEWMANPNFLSDDEHFRRRGYQAVMLTTHPWGTQPVHHTPDDRIEHLDMTQIAELTDLLWAWITVQAS